MKVNAIAMTFVCLLSASLVFQAGADTPQAKSVDVIKRDAKHWIHAADTSTEGKNYMPLVEGAILFSSDTMPPEAAANWQKVRLPFLSRGKPFKEIEPVAWFRFPVAQTNTPAAIYLRRYRTVAQVYLNDVHLGGTENQEGWMTTYWNHPLLVNVPNNAWRADNNWLYLRVEGPVYGPVSSVVLYGDHLELLSLWQSQTFRQADVSRWSFFICLSLAVVALWLWRIRPQDRLYLQYAGACLSWSVVLWYLWGVTFPGSLSLFLWVLHACIDLTLLLLIMFVNQVMSLKMRRQQSVLCGIWLFGTLVSFLVPAEYFYRFVYLLHTAWILLLMFAVFRGVYLAYQQKSTTSSWILLGLIGMVLFGIRDTLVFTFADNEVWISSMHLSQFSGLFLLLCLFGHLGQRFLNALNETDRLNRELESRVEEKTEELRKVHQENLQLEVTRSNLAQREQIYRDLHDDVGSKLVSIIQASKEVKSTDYARAALENLRAAIFQAKYPDLSLDQLLADCHEEIALRVEAVGNRFSWSQAGEAEGIQLSGDSNYHLTRIIREATTNSLKFGLNAPIHVDVQISAELLQFSVSNEVVDGALALAGFSNGLSNIRYRAEAIGAMVDWSATEIQMVFLLSMPITSPVRISRPSVV